MTDPITVPDEDLKPDTTDPEPDESPKTDPVPDDAEAPPIVINTPSVTVHEDDDTEDDPS